MGVEPFLTASAISAVLAQRLARKLCTSCCQEYQPGEADLRAARVPEHEFDDYMENSSFRRAAGCPRCSNTGYRGRVGIFQLLRMNDDLESLVASGATRDMLEQAAYEGGMRPLWEDGLAKVREGVTSVEELARVLV
jgi:type II secretory ATPase GspE/PulE/Tfp pilus assembly ATPase PilB-like protein